MSPITGTIIEFMKSNMNRDLVLRDMAECVNLSASRVRSLFRTELQISPMQYLKQLRVQKAGELLANSSLSIKQVMLEAGFRDESHFARDFKKSTGLTPSQFRARRDRKRTA